jgi:hypothetical protein
MKFYPTFPSLQRLFHLRYKNFIYLKCLIVATLLGNSAIAQTNVYFEIQNEQVVRTNYEFDIYMYADQLNTFHSRGHVYIVYNPAAFGTNVVLNGNCSYNHLTLLDGIAMSGPIPIGAKYSTINFVDNGNRIVLTWLSNFLFAPPSTTAHNLVPMTPTPLYHVTLAIQDPTKSPNLALDLGLMYGQIFYFNNALTGAEIQYSFGQLPATLSSFTAEPIGKKEALIEWTTEGEENTSHYTLEKKIGNGNFFEIATITAQNAGAAESDYAYTDATFMGEENTYRLRSVNINGDVVYSHEVVVNFSFSYSDLIITYPNPTKDNVRVSSTALLEDDYYLELSNLSGVVLQKVVLKKGELDMMLPMQDYPEGVYLMRIDGPNGPVSVKRIVKQ